MFRRFVKWLADASAKVLLTSLLGSAAVTSLVSRVVKSVVAMSWEWAWVLWTTTAFIAYVALLRTSGTWGQFLTGSERVRTASANSGAASHAGVRLRPFDPRLVQTDVRMVVLTALIRKEPYLSFEVVIDNLSGEDVAISGIRRGRVRIGDDISGMSPTLTSPHGPLPVQFRADSRNLYGVTVIQPVTKALADNIIAVLESPTGLMTFDLSGLEFDGTIGFDNAAKPLPSVLVSTGILKARGPMRLRSDEDPNVTRVDPVFVSQVFYDADGVPRSAP
jgi:hypothetical protein